MNLFFKASVGAIITIILCLALHKQGKDFALVISISVCCMILMGLFTYLDPIIDFFEELQQIGQINSSMFRLLIKAMGLGLLSEIVTLICNDAGNSALGKSIQLVATAVIIWICLPLFQQLIDLLKNILGEL